METTPSPNPGGRRWSLPRFALNHPHFTIVVSLLMVALGVWAYLAIPVRMVPRIPTPDIGVVTQFPGMSAEDMERYITRPLEKRIQIVGGVNYLLGTSQAGYSKIVVYFDYDVDFKKKWQEMQALLNTISNELPKAGANTTVPRLVHVNIQNVPTIQFAVERPGMSRTALKSLLNNVVLTQFQLIPHVLSASTFGGPDRQIRVVVDRDKLAAYGLDILAVRKAIDAANFDHGGGALLSSGDKIDVQIKNEFRESGILRRLPALPVGQDKGRIVYVRDVATVKDTHAQLYGDFFYDGHPAVWLGVQAEGDKNYLSVIHRAKNLAHLLEDEYPGMKIHVAFDQSFYIKLNDKNALHEFILAVLLASLSMFLFLGDYGGTLIAAAILPSAVAFGFFLIKILGFQRDFGIMMGMVFIVGKILDDSIVVVEVIRRNIERGLPSREAAIRGAEEVQNAITAATLTFAIMLYPMTRMTGDMGSGFRSMTVPMITTVVTSLFLALTLTPLMASFLFKSNGNEVSEFREPTAEEQMAIPEEPSPGRVGRVMHRLFIRHFHRFEHVFARFVNWSVQHKWVVLTATGGAIWVALSLFDTLGQEQMPLTDTSLMLGYVRATPGTSPDRMRQIIVGISRIALKEKNVKDISATTGESPVWGDYFTGYGVNRMNEARLILNLTIAREQRTETLWDIEDRIVKKARATIPDLDVLFFQPLSPTPVAAARAPVEVLAKGTDLDQVYSFGQQIMGIAQTQAVGLHNPYLDTVYGEPQVTVQVDEARARQLGLSVQNIVGQVFYAINGGMTGTFFNPDPMYYHSRILVRYRAGQRKSIKDLQQLKIGVFDGHIMRSIPLSAVARIRETVGYNRIHTYNTLYAASVLGYYKELGLKETTMNLLVPSKIQLSLPKGYAVGPAGLMGTMLQAFNELPTGLKIALVAVYLLLVIQFRSFSIALVLMLAIPLEGVGSLEALRLRGMDWSPPVLWGMVLLAGIVLSNSILVVDKILHLRRLGVERSRAVVAASVLRLRPVLMTAIAAGIAMFPVALNPPPATEQFRNIATAVVGGLLTSTIMTLVVIPVAYTIMDDLVTLVRRFYVNERMDWNEGEKNSPSS